MTTMISTQGLMQEDSGFSESTHYLKQDISDLNSDLEGRRCRHLTQRLKHATRTLTQALKQDDSDLNSDPEARILRL